MLVTYHLLPFSPPHRELDLTMVARSYFPEYKTSHASVVPLDVLVYMYAYQSLRGKIVEMLQWAMRGLLSFHG